MSFFLANIFAGVLFFVLTLMGWKRSIIYANYKLAKKWNKEIFPFYFWKFYYKLIWNISCHASEFLFCFFKYKKLPININEYPYKVGEKKFFINPQSIQVIEKMRKGGIFLTAHYGNYEIMGPWLLRLGIPLIASYKPIKPTFLNRILESYIRTVDKKSYGIDAKSPREFLRHLNEKKLFCLLSDQDSRISGARDGLFFGTPIKVNPLPEFLLKHIPNTPVYICWVEEDGTNKYLNAIELKEVSPKNVMNQFNLWLEDRIKNNPYIWYGFTHRRFLATQPKIYE